MELLQSEYIKYVAWLPDRQVILFEDPEKWNDERLKKLGLTENYLKFWQLMNKVTEVFGMPPEHIKLPVQNLRDVINVIQIIGLKSIFLVKHLNLTMTDVLKNSIQKVINHRKEYCQHLLKIRYIKI